MRIKGQGQRSCQGQRSIFWHKVVDIRGSALPSATKSNESHYQSKVFVCVSDNSTDALNRLLLIKEILLVNYDMSRLV